MLDISDMSDRSLRNIQKRIRETYSPALEIHTNFSVPAEDVIISLIDEILVLRRKNRKLEEKINASNYYVYNRPSLP